MADRFPSLDDIDAGAAAEIHNIPAAAPGSASFLEREIALLGDDAHQFASSSDAHITAALNNDLLGHDEMDFSAESVVPAASGLFESQFPDLSTEHMPIPISNYRQPSPKPVQQDSPAIAAWRAKQAEDIAKRDAKSDAAEKATIAAAKKEIDEYYEKYNDKKYKIMAQSQREAEEFLKTRQDTTAGGTSWARIAKMVDLSGKGVKGGAAVGGKQRFRELLQELEKDLHAPGVAGV